MLDYAISPLNRTQISYLNERMEEVSRSFAIVVPMLEQPFNHFMAAAYLLCRVVDNIEDCMQPYVWRQQRFEEFLHLLDSPAEAATIVARWEAESWPGLTANEQKMMTVQGGLPLWQIYAGLPADAMATMRQWTATMARGMSDIEMPQQSPRLVERDDVRVLETVQDYNRYCFVVAGTVGHMATELAAQHYRMEETTTASLIADCEACGRALQKTNIVKDFAKDLDRGISFLPDEWLRAVDHSPLSLGGAPSAWTRMVLDDVLNELRRGVEYLVLLPYSAKGYRMAALLCLLPAYETILLAATKQETLFTPDHQVKISRVKMAQCKHRAKSMLGDNAAVRRYSLQMEEAILSAVR